jgi:hypothetical protein
MIAVETASSRLKKVTNQPHWRPASPKRGQLAETMGIEPRIELDSAELGKGWEGSFHAVPNFSTAIQVFNYFREHPPPDATVFRLRRLVNTRHAAELKASFDAEFDARMDRWDQENPIPSVTKRRQVEAGSEHRVRRRAFSAKLAQEMRRDVRYHTDPLSPYDAFSLAIVLARWRVSRDLPVAERDKIEAIITGWRDEPTGKPLSHNELVHRHRLDEIADAVLDPEYEHREIITLLHELKAELDRTSYSQHQAAVALQDLAYDDQR